MNKKETVVKKSKIEIEVGLNQDQHPIAIHWRSDDNPHGEDFSEAKAMLVSFFDAEHLDTYKIDLWTKEMQVAEMDRLMFQTLRALTDTYHKATRNDELANDMAKFVEYFGRQTEIIPKED